jgi:hypothetical protein
VKYFEVWTKIEISIREINFNSVGLLKNSTLGMTLLFHVRQRI